MSSRKGTRERSNKKTLPPKTRTVQSPEKNRDLNECPLSRLSITDVIYENVALEAEEDTHVRQPHSQVNFSKAGFVDLQSYVSEIATTSLSDTVDKPISLQLEEDTSLTSAACDITLSNQDLSDLSPVKTKEYATNGVSVQPLSINKDQHDSSRTLRYIHEYKDEPMRNTSSSVKVSKISKTDTLPRRESGIFLLSDPADFPVVHGECRGPQSARHQSSSKPSRNSSRWTNTRGINSQMLVSREELWLETLESKLVVVTEGNPTITLAKFKEALQVTQSFFVDRCFHILDYDGHGEVSLRLLIGQLRSLVYGTKTDKLRFLFNIYNIRGTFPNIIAMKSQSQSSELQSDLCVLLHSSSRVSLLTGTGKIDKDELHLVLKSCIEESRLHFTNEDLQALTDAFVSWADKNSDGRISFDDLKDMVDKNPTVAENLTVSSLLSATQTGIDYDPLEFIMSETPIKKQSFCRHISKTYIQNNSQKIFFLIVYILINAGLGVVNGWRYWHLNVWLIVARTSGLCLDMNCTFVVVLMLRRLITSLRATPLVNILPFDQHIMFHKICGCFIALQSFVHSVAHVGNAFVVANEQELSILKVIFTNAANIGWVYGTAPVTGVALCVVLMIMLILSLPVIRSRGCFEVFYWSHKLYIVMLALLIVHAQDFWKWFVVPGLVFVLEAVLRISWVRSAYMGRTYIESVCLLPSEVTQLIITKPPDFTFRPGDYVYIQIPAIAKYEWHPFTISSAPEQKDTLWLHIRSAGYWTKSLHDYFTNYVYEDVEAGVDSAGTYETLKKCNLKRRASSIAWAKQKPLKARQIESNMRKRVVTKQSKVLCHIDGPYGTPSRHIFDSEHAVLVGSGIGITPFASILQSIVNQFKAGCVSCPKCKYTWCHTLPATVMNLKKVDFVWINRDQRHFEWFVSLLTRLEREQEVEGGLGHILDMHMYMTSALPKTDMKGFGLQLALDLIHENERTDLITGLQTRTQTGRPDFDVLFRKIQANAKGQVTVFFCGSPLLGKTLKHYTHKYGFTFRHENF